MKKLQSLEKEQEKKFENLEKKQHEMEKTINSMIEMLKKSPVVNQFVKEEILKDIRFVDGEVAQHMLIYS